VQLGAFVSGEGRGFSIKGRSRADGRFTQPAVDKQRSPRQFGRTFEGHFANTRASDRPLFSFASSLSLPGCTLSSSDVLDGGYDRRFETVGRYTEVIG
jgi:hypothetical protein